MEQPEACIVRIADERGKPLGTGFLVQTQRGAPLVVTCHHVVREREVQAAFPGEKGRPARLPRRRTCRPQHEAPGASMWKVRWFAELEHISVVRCTGRGGHSPRVRCLLGCLSV